MAGLVAEKIDSLGVEDEKVALKRMEKNAALSRLNQAEEIAKRYSI